MKVLYFYQYFSTPAGSTGTRAYEMAKHLVHHGHDVTVVCGDCLTASTGLDSEMVGGCRSGIVDGIKIIQLDLPYSNKQSLLKRTGIFLRYAFGCVRIAFRSDANVLFASTTPLTAGIPGIVLKLVRPRLKFVFEVRDLWPELPRAMGVIKNPVILSAMSGLEWLSYKCADGCIGLAPGIAEGICERSNSKKEIEVIPNGCDLDLFTYGGELDQDGLREKWGLPRGGIIAAFIGTHGVANGLHAVIDAAIELKERGRDDISLLFVGDGNQKDDLLRLVSEHSLTNCIFRDYVPKQDLGELLAAVDVGLQILLNVPAFYRGTSPNKFFDYLSAGLPVINNYPGWLAGVIQEHRCGSAIPPDDPGAFADALCGYADHRERLTEQGQRSLQLAREKFDRTSQANAWMGFLQKIADSP